MKKLAEAYAEKNYDAYKYKNLTLKRSHELAFMAGVEAVLDVLRKFKMSEDDIKRILKDE